MGHTLAHAQKPASAVIKAADITRVHYGYIVVPEDAPDAGQPRPVTGFVIDHPDGLLLFDTGMSEFDEETEAVYHPRRRWAGEALRESGIDPSDITAIVNCHLHADHAGGNHEFPGVPIYVQKAELEAAAEPDYTFPKFAFDFPDANLQVIEGEHQLRPNVRIVPTPGHTAGHQSLLVDTDEGVVMLAGQASDTSWTFSSQAFAERLDTSLGDRIGDYPAWISGLREWNVSRAFFAHDLLVWERDDSDLGRPARA
jgi:N-acyl homoserine lactone hydrolase